LVERLERNIRFDGDGCWLWFGTTNEFDYGVIVVDRRMRRAHRVVYELLVGPVNAPHLHHQCGNPACVNPAHLQPLSVSDHRALHAAAVTHCPQGHLYDEANTYLIPGTQSRQCRECKREADRRYRERKRGPR
jgi:hypothetical protein